MRFALIGHTGHVNYYEPALRDIHGFEVVAVSRAAETEDLARLDGAPGVTRNTPRYAGYMQMLERESPDLVQICAPINQIAEVVELCLRRGIAVVAEKPLGRDLETL